MSSFEEIKKENFINYLLNDKNEIEFDLYAQDINDWKWIEKISPNTIVSSAGGLLPFQAEGLLQEYPFYFRKEDDTATLFVYAKDSELTYLPEDSIYSSSIDCLNEEESKVSNWLNDFFNLVEVLEKTKNRYSFVSKKVTFKDGKIFGIHPSETDYTSGWGYTPEQAFQNMTEFYENYEGLNSIKEIFKLKSPDKNNYALEGKDHNDFAEPNFVLNIPEIWRNENGKINMSN